MNGVFTASIIMALVGIIGLAIGMIFINREIELLKEEQQRTDEYAHENLTKHEKAIINSWNEIQTVKSETNENANQVKDIRSAMNRISSDANADIATLSRKIYGTGDLKEFERVKTAAYAADMRSKSLEKVVHAMAGTSGPYGPRKTIRNGLITMSVADDARVIDAEVRNHDEPNQ